MQARIGAGSCALGMPVDSFGWNLRVNGLTLGARAVDLPRSPSICGLRRLGEPIVEGGALCAQQKRIVVPAVV